MLKDFRFSSLCWNDRKQLYYEDKTQEAPCLVIQREGGLLTRAGGRGYSRMRNAQASERCIPQIEGVRDLP